MDIIFLSDLRVETVIGIWDWERKIRQTVSIDLEMAADIAKAAATDDVKDTLNYKLVAKRLQQFVGDSDFQLVETLAEKIAAIVLDEFDVADDRDVNDRRAASRQEVVGVGHLPPQAE